MKKSLGVLASVALIALSGQTFADQEMKIGEKIYKRAFGMGCDNCHQVKTNPQLAEKIKDGSLTREIFGKVLKEGKNGMPAAMHTIMNDIKPVKKAGYTEEQAIDALFKFLSN